MIRYRLQALCCAPARCRPSILGCDCPALGTVGLLAILGASY